MTPQEKKIIDKINESGHPDLRIVGLSVVVCILFWIILIAKIYVRLK